jgi:hypothetical protein
MKLLLFEDDPITLKLVNSQQYQKNTNRSPIPWNVIPQLPLLDDLDCIGYFLTSGFKLRHRKGYSPAWHHGWDLVAVTAAKGALRSYSNLIPIHRRPDIIRTPSQEPSFGGSVAFHHDDGVAVWHRHVTFKDTKQGLFLQQVSCPTCSGPHIHLELKPVGHPNYADVFHMRDLEILMGLKEAAYYDKGAFVINARDLALLKPTLTQEVWSYITSTLGFSQQDVTDNSESPLGRELPMRRVISNAQLDRDERSGTARFIEAVREMTSALFKDDDLDQRPEEDPVVRKIQDLNTAALPGPVLQQQARELSNINTERNFDKQKEIYHLHRPRDISKGTS